ncbi:hypothetical protein [Halodesulfovibrio spirochaetisodalis]|nr:hypothetical protein [Halodesulfovibrio spirochaetisodalis]
MQRYILTISQWSAGLMQLAWMLSHVEMNEGRVAYGWATEIKKLK